jgi:hypothetical protein
VRRFVRLIPLCVFLLVASANTRAADVPGLRSGILDGQQFKGETGEHGKRNHHQDTITFKDGVFRSLDCENWGFGSAPYSARKEGDSYHFSATLLSPERGRLEWKGTITGDVAEGTFRWLHERWYWTIERHYWFKGTRHAGP